MSQIKRAKLKDVAERAGVSMMTVSRVINNNAKVRPATRERVLAAAKELNYEPNVSARSLSGARSKQARSYLIGMLYDNPSAAYLSELLLGSMRACQARGCQLVVEFCGTPGEERTAMLERLQSHHWDGVILPPPVCNDREIVAAFQEAEVSVVQVAPDNTLTGVPSIHIDDYRAAYDMTRYLTSLGHKRIGFVRGPGNQGASYERYRGYCSALADGGLDADPDYIAEGEFSFESGMECGDRILNASKPPTAIFASNDDMAAGVLSAAQRAGIRVPQDLSIAGFDDTPVATLVWPGLTTIRQPISEMAHAAIDCFFPSDPDEEGSAAARLSQKLVLDFELVIRDSTGPVPKKDKA